MGAGQGVLENVRHRYEEPKCVFLFDLVTTVYVGTGSLLEPSFGAQPYSCGALFLPTDAL